MKGSLPPKSLTNELTALGRTPHALGIYSVSAEVDEGRVKWVQSSSIKLQLLKSRKVDDVYRATVVHEDPLSVESFYREHYDQGVVVRLLHSPSIFLVERHVLVYSSLLKRRYHVNAIHLPLTSFPKGSE